MKTSAADIVEDFVSLFFPRTCFGCRNALVKGEDLLCTKCILELPRSNYHLLPENPFYQKLRGRIPLKSVMSFLKFAKGGSVQRILHALKYKNHPELGFKLGEIYGNELKNHGFSNQFDVIVPVPLHSSKKKLRGYNQSERFGQGLGKALELPCSDDFVKRVSVTDTQTRKSRLRRWENVKDVFKVEEKGVFRERSVLLVDDVVTTGATLESLAQVVIEDGCSDVSIAAIAATQ